MGHSSGATPTQNLQKREYLLSLGKEQFYEKFVPLMEYAQTVYLREDKYDQMSLKKLLGEVGRISLTFIAQNNLICASSGI